MADRYMVKVRDTEDCGQDIGPFSRESDARAECYSWLECEENITITLLRNGEAVIVYRTVEPKYVDSERLTTDDLRREEDCEMRCSRCGNFLDHDHDEVSICGDCEDAELGADDTGDYETVNDADGWPICPACSSADNTYRFDSLGNSRCMSCGAMLRNRVVISREG